jgi:hypothetical protein
MNMRQADDSRTSSMPPERPAALGTADVAAARRPEHDEDVTRRRGTDPGREAQAGRTVAPDPEALAPLFAGAQAEQFRARWNTTQIGFVDDPQQSVRQADELVAEVMRDLADNFAQERSRLESQMRDGGQPSTEDLRVALRRYRSFFERLLKL